jgi:hypothetical protein
LRLTIGKSRDSKLIEVRARQRNLESFVSCYVPPAVGVPSGDPERRATDASAVELAVRRPATLPLFEMQHPQAAV